MANKEEKLAKIDHQNEKNPSLPEQPKEFGAEGAKTPGKGNVNPFGQGRKGTTGGTGGVNPSDPTTGTEG